MDYRANQRARKEAGDKEAMELLQLLSVDQVAQVANHFRAVTGSPYNSRNRHYIKAGRCAYIAIRARLEADLLPKDIMRFFAAQRRGGGVIQK